MTTLSDLLTLPTAAEVLDRLLAFARLARFPIASWQSGSVPSSLFKGESSVLSDLAQSIMLVAQGGLLDFAEEEWLDLLGWNVFNERRKLAGFAEHTIVLTAAAGAGPYVVQAGNFWVSTPDGSKRFVTTTGGTLPLSGTLTLTVKAESVGAAYNLPPGSITLQVTPLAGVSVTNAGGVSGTSITVQGVDAERDADYRQRCRDKWSTLGAGANDGAYRYWATTASAEVTRVKVTGNPETGVVTTVVAGASGPISAGEFAIVAAAIEANRPLGVLSNPVNAQVSTVTVAGTVYVLPGFGATAALQAARDAADAYARLTSIGDVVYPSRITAAIQGAEGVSHVALTSPANDVALPAERVAGFLYALGAA